MDDQKSFSDHNKEFANINAVPTIDPITYESVIKTIVQKLKNMPAVIVFEPDFLEKTFNQRYQQYRWDNAIIEDLVIGKGLQKLINSLPMAKVYLDIGSLSYGRVLKESLFCSCIFKSCHHFFMNFQTSQSLSITKQLRLAFRI